MNDIGSHARVVVIGGGVVGCSILYHLAKKGWQDCVLLERRELSCGSSWHAAGQFHIINSNANLSQLQLHTLKFYPQLQEESGQDIGLHRTGGLYFASTEERENYLIMELAKNRHINPDMRFISLDEAKRMHPLIDKSQFRCALYDPLDGHIDPASVVQAYAKAARLAGAKIFQKTMVSATTQNTDKSWVVTTNKGDIQADYVVNAGGLWAREVGHMVDIELPLMAMEHHYLITEPLPQIASLENELPSMVDFDGNAYGRQEGKGMLLGTYEKNGTAWSVDSTPWDFGHELLPNQLDRIADRLETAFEHFPPLATAGIKKVVNGPFVFAPDGNALVGPVPNRPNYWVACGVMAGFCQGAGIGQVLADWIIEGEPGMDIFAMDVARFGDFATRHYAHQKVIENFGRRFQISYPNEELPAMRPWRTTALYDIFKAQGAVFGSSFGLEHALWFANNAENAVEIPSFRRSNAFDYVAKEVNHVRNHVGLIELANFAKYEITGNDANDFINTVMAGKMPTTGKMRLSPMLSLKGKLLGDLSVAKMADNHFLIIGSGAAQVAHTRWFAHTKKINADVCINNRSNDWHGIAIAGPDSRHVLAKLTRTDISKDAFDFMSIQKMEVDGIPAIVARVSFTGDLGYEIYCSNEFQLALYNAICTAGQVFDIKPFGARALMSMRLEKNFGAWALDFREDFSAQEAGLSCFIDYNKESSFIGKAAALQQRDNGVTQQRVAFVIDVNDADVHGDEPVLLNNHVVGFVTSGGYGHFVQQSIAIAYIEADLVASDEQFHIEILNELRPATIQKEPLFDPQGLKMRS